MASGPSSCGATSSACPCCGTWFACGAGDPAVACWCVGVALTDPLRARLAETFVGCLCPGCLAAEAAVPEPVCHDRVEDGEALACQVWRFGSPRRVLSSAPVGGGLGERTWLLNAQVPLAYARTDLGAHVASLAAAAGLDHDGPGEVERADGAAAGGVTVDPDGTPGVGPGVGMLTAAHAKALMAAVDGGVRVWATVGISTPCWAADAGDGDPSEAVGGDGARTAGRPVVVDGPPRPGTINIVVSVPVPMTDEALVNLAMTVTEAKTQALLALDVDGTGTPTDAVAVVAPPVGEDARAPERFGGTRSRWGAPVARATHAAVADGVRDWRRRAGRPD